MPLTAHQKRLQRCQFSQVGQALRLTAIKFQVSARVAGQSEGRLTVLLYSDVRFVLAGNLRYLSEAHRSQAKA